MSGLRPRRLLPERRSSVWEIGGATRWPRVIICSIQSVWRSGWLSRWVGRGYYGHRVDPVDPLVLSTSTGMGISFSVGIGVAVAVGMGRASAGRSRTDPLADHLPALQAQPAPALTVECSGTRRAKSSRARFLCPYHKQAIYGACD